MVATFSADGDWIHVHDRFGNLETLDRATLQPAFDSVAVGDVRVLAPHPRDGTVLGLTVDGSIVRVDPEAGRVVATGPAGQLSPDDYDTDEPPGRLVPGRVTAGRTPSGRSRPAARHRHTRVGRRGVIGRLGTETSPTPRTEASSPPSMAGWIRIWDGRTGAYQAGIPLPDAATDATVAYLPDGAGLLVSALDGRTWTVDTRMHSVGGTSVPDRRPQPDPERMEAVLPRPALRGHLPPVARGQLTTVAALPASSVGFGCLSPGVHSGSVGD